MKSRLLFPLLLILHGCSPLKIALPGTDSPSSENTGLRAQLSRDPITTSFADADKARVFPDTFGDDKVYRPLEVMPKSSAGAYLLTPGFYEMTAQSYCLKAGTYGPSAGDAYLFAPLKGKRAAVVQALVQRRAQHPQIPQQDIQALLWAIIAKAKFSNLSPRLKVVAAQLLRPEELLDLNGGALSLIPDALLNGILNALPEPLRVIIRAENQVRGMLYDSNASFSDLEGQAILAGMAPLNPEFKRGRWSKHKDGFFIRYFPSGYSRTRVQVYIPSPEGQPQPGSTSAIEFDATDDVAVPANTGAQRLLQSNQPVPASSGTCPQGLGIGSRQGGPALIQEGAWDRSCRALALCVASLVEGVSKVEGAGTGQPLLSDDSNGFSVFFTPLDANKAPASRSTPWEANSLQLRSGDRLRDWLVEHHNSVGLTEVVWNGQTYSAKDGWKGSKGSQEPAHYERLRVSCKTRPTRD